MTRFSLAAPLAVAATVLITAPPAAASLLALNTANAVALKSLSAAPQPRLSSGRRIATPQQSGVQVLSLANSEPQQLLQLLKQDDPPARSDDSVQLRLSTGLRIDTAAESKEGLDDPAPVLLSLKRLSSSQSILRLTDSDEAGRLLPSGSRDDAAGLTLRTRDYGLGKDDGFGKNGDFRKDDGSGWEGGRRDGWRSRGSQDDQQLQSVLTLFRGDPTENAMPEVRGIDSRDVVNELMQSQGLHGAIPEPATWLTMIAGFGVIGASLRRRRVAVGA